MLAVLISLLTVLRSHNANDDIFRMYVLGNNTLDGQLPSEFGELKSLAILVLDNNTLTGSIPTQIGNLTQLQSLALGKIKLKQFNVSVLWILVMVNIWMNLTCAICLCMFAKGNNKLSGSIPSEIGTIKSLSNFSLGKTLSSYIYLCMHIDGSFI